MKYATSAPAPPHVLCCATARLPTAALAELGAVPVRVGQQTLPLDLSRAQDVRVDPLDAAAQVAWTLLVRQGDTEVYRQSQSTK